jgi:hypothetical protein
VRLDVRLGMQIDEMKNEMFVLGVRLGVQNTM